MVERPPDKLRFWRCYIHGKLRVFARAYGVAVMAMHEIKRHFAGVSNAYRLIFTRISDGSALGHGSASGWTKERLRFPIAEWIMGADKGSASDV